MAWDSTKSPGDLITAKIWNDMVTDQKNHAGRHADGGSDALGTDAVTSTQIKAGSVGSSEVDESAGFSFSNLGATTITGDLDMSNNNINDVASIDGGGDAVNFNDSINMSGNPLILQDGNNIEFGTDTDANLRYVSSEDWVEFGEVGVQALARIKLGSGDFEIVNGALNMDSSGSIQDAGTDAIQFDGSAKVTIPTGTLEIGENLDLNSNKMYLFDTGTEDWKIERTQRSYAVNVTGNAFKLTARDASNNQGFIFTATEDRTVFEINTDTSNVTIPNGNLDLNNNSIDDVASIDGGGNAITSNDNIDFGGSSSKINLNQSDPVIDVHDGSLTFGLEITQKSTALAQILNGAAGGMEIGVSNSSGNPVKILADNNNVLEMQGNGNVIVQSGNLNMAASDSIQDAGTDAIQFDGSGIDKIRDKKDRRFSINDPGGFVRLVSKDYDIDLLTNDASFNDTKRILVNSGSDIVDVDIQNANLDLNDNLIIDPSNNTTADSMTANPETDSEDGFIEVEINGTTRQIPFYDQ